MAELTQGYVIREATVNDAPVLARQRCAMFRVMGMLGDAAVEEELEREARGWIARELARGAFYSWVVEYGEGVEGREGAAEIVAGGGLQLRDLMPRPGHAQGGKEGLILSVWTDDAHRRRGLATAVVEAMLAWCRAQGVRRVTLHASADGRRVYERLGFAQTNEMRLELSD